MDRGREEERGRKEKRGGCVNALPRNECNQKKIARPVLHIIYKPRWGLMSVFSGRRGNWKEVPQRAMMAEGGRRRGKEREKKRSTDRWGRNTGGKRKHVIFYMTAWLHFPEQTLHRPSGRKKTSTLIVALSFSLLFSLISFLPLVISCSLLRFEISLGDVYKMFPPLFVSRCDRLFLLRIRFLTLPILRHWDPKRYLKSSRNIMTNQP